MSTVKNYLSLIKFSHTIFAMPFAMIGFFLAATGSTGYFGLLTQDYRQVLLKFVLVIACMVFARSAAMAFNRYLDRHFDAQNPRTAIREIPAGIISADKALWFTIGSSLLFVLTTYFINPLCFYLSPGSTRGGSGIQFYKTFYSALSPGSWPGPVFGTNWRLSCSYG